MDQVTQCDCEVDKLTNITLLSELLDHMSTVGSWSIEENN